MWFQSSRSRELAEKLAALDKSQAIIEFDMGGRILTANQRFLDALGYRLDEIQGQHHRIFVEPATAASPDYARFWDALNRGEYQAAQFKRIGKGGKEVWIEASYNPILDVAGRPYKVVKFATDVTNQKIEYANLLGQVNAIHKSQGVIEFSLDGKVLTANDNFLRALGYTLAEIQGRHHSQFVEATYRTSSDYVRFWESLNRGEYQAGQFKRLGKNGKEVWIEASYNPILDLNGKPVKVVKYATDITAQITLLTNLKSLIDRNFGEINQAIHLSSSEATKAAHVVAETSSNVQMMASSAEELAASIREISATMAKSNAATNDAVNQLSGADQSTQRLMDAARAMGGIVELIQNIASQINLLALNATIESARAGEAGRGFAVVAVEVKNLAKQAADATDQIAREIEGMQSVSGDVVHAIGAITKSVENVREYVAQTASAVDEQSSVTQGMSSSMQGTANAVSAINSNMMGILGAVEQAASALDSTTQAARILAR